MNSNDFYWQVQKMAADARVKTSKLLDEAGVSRQAVHRWKTGAVSPTMRTWQRIEQAAKRLREEAAA